jgi:hypothetical protein
MAKKTKITNGERAMYTFFISTLVGPFFAALIIAVLTLGSGIVQKGPPSIIGLPFAEVAAKAGGWALQSYMWAALPAGLAGAALAAWVSLRGSFPWIVAVVAGVVAFGIASVLIPGLLPNHNTALAVIAALSALGVWLVLRRAGIIAPD